MDREKSSGRGARAQRGTRLALSCFFAPLRLCVSILPCLREFSVSYFVLFFLPLPPPSPPPPPHSGGALPLFHSSHLACNSLILSGIDAARSFDSLISAPRLYSCAELTGWPPAPVSVSAFVS